MCLIDPGNRFVCPVGCQDVEVTVLVDVCQVNDVGPVQFGTVFVQQGDFPCRGFVPVPKHEHTTGTIGWYDHIREPVAVEIADIEAIRVVQLARNRSELPSIGASAVLPPCGVAAIEARLYTIQVTVSVDVGQTHVVLRDRSFRKLSDPAPCRISGVSSQWSSFPSSPSTIDVEQQPGVGRLWRRGDEIDVAVRVDVSSIHTNQGRQCFAYRDGFPVGARIERCTEQRQVVAWPSD